MMTTFRCGLMSDVLVDKLLQVSFISEADDRFHNLAALEDEDGRNTAYAEQRGGVRILVDVELPDGDFAIVIARERVDGRRQAPARAAPLGPEVDEHGFVGLDHALIEIAVGENLKFFGCHRLSHKVRLKADITKVARSA